MVLCQRKGLILEGLEVKQSQEHTSILSPVSFNRSPVPTLSLGLDTLPRKLLLFLCDPEDLE